MEGKVKVQLELKDHNLYNNHLLLVYGIGNEKSAFFLWMMGLQSTGAEVS